MDRVMMRSKGTDFNTVLAAFSGNEVDNLFKVATLPEFSEISEVEFQVNAGNRYYIAVDSSEYNAAGQIDLAWRYILNLENVHPNVGLLNEDLKVTLTGTKFGTDVRLSMYTVKESTDFFTDLIYIDGGVKDLAISESGKRAYVVNGVGMQIVDISDPFNLKLLGFKATQGNASAIAVSGTYTVT